MKASLLLSTKLQASRISPQIAAPLCPWIQEWVLSLRPNNEAFTPEKPAGVLVDAENSLKSFAVPSPPNDTHASRFQAANKDGLQSTKSSLVLIS